MPRRPTRRLGAALLALLLLVTSGASAAGSLCVTVGMAGMGPGETCCPTRDDARRAPDALKKRCCCAASVWEARRAPSEEASRAQSGVAARVVVGVLPVVPSIAGPARVLARGERDEERARSPGPPLILLKQSFLI